MTDPVAEAAAKIAAQQADTTFAAQMAEAMHNLEAKMEHLIHPEAVSVSIEKKPSLSSAPIATASIVEAPAVNGPGEALPSGTPADSGTSLGSSGPASTETDPGNVDAGTAQPASFGSDTSVQTVSETVVDLGNVAGAAVAGAPEAGGAAVGGGELPNAQGATASQTASSAPSGIDTTSTTSSQGSGSNIPDTLTSQALSTEPAGSIEVPNAAPVAVVQPDTSASVPVASTPAGIPGIVASSAEPLKTVGATPSMIAACHIDKIRESVGNIKRHLSIRGFEQSAVADIHAELDAIEKWL